MPQHLKDRIVVIAGGSSGIGLSIAGQAADAGAQVHIIGRSADRLGEAKATLGSKVTTHQVDIGIEAEVHRFSERFGHVDHLVTTAAELTFKPFTETTDSDIQAMLASKFWGPIYLVRHLAPRMAPSGSVTLYSGLAAYKANPGGSIVAAVNGALDGLARTLAVELAPIRVNVVSPGVVDSPTWDFLPPESRASVLSDIGTSLPVGRVGRTDELAAAGIFVMGNGFTTGTVLQIDGGANA